MGGPATSEVTFGVTTVRESGAGASGVAAPFLRRSDKAGGGGTVGAAFCGRISSSIGVAAGAVRKRVFAAIIKPISTATCNAITPSNATYRDRPHRCDAYMDQADLVVGV